VSERKLPPVADALAYWSEGKVQVVLHGLTHRDDRATELTTAQALRLAEMLVRSARQGLAEPPTGLEYRGG
jgi:hypothetical protein